MPDCRICTNKLGKPFLSLGNTPLANSFLTEDKLHEMEPYYPLDVYVCERCFLVQLEEIVKAEEIFSSDYAYFSSYSDTWLEHCKKYTLMIIEKLKLNRNSFVLEIGSNDGYLLQYFKQYGIPVLGVEPASNVAKVAQEKGIPTDIVFFDTHYAQKMNAENKRADLIIANNVLAHNPNLNDFVEGLRIALKPAGVITVEFPHLLKLMQENQFDTIYHEHFSYFSLHSAQNLFARHSLEVFDVEEIPTHGGSLRIYVKHKNDDTKPTTEGIKELIDKENSAGLLNLNTYHSFSQKVEKTKRKLLQLLIQIKNDNKKIVGYGAPAKANTLLNYCGIRTDFIDYTVDRSPYKQGRYLPGTHIPIKHPDKVKEDKPDYVLILPWNLKDEIMQQMNFIREWGGRFIIPIPEVEVV